MTIGKRGRTTSIVYHEEEDGSSILTEAERREIEEQVDDEIHELRVAEERKRYKEKVKQRKRIKAGLDEPQEEVVINVAGHSDKIRLDGKIFWQGHSYTLPASVAASIRDIMQCTWNHEWSCGGANMNEYRKPLESRVSSGTNRGYDVQNAPTINPAVNHRPGPSVNFNTAKGISGGAAR
jgi:hypothetical protein